MQRQAMHKSGGRASGDRADPGLSASRSCGAAPSDATMTDSVKDLRAARAAWIEVMNKHQNVSPKHRGQIHEPMRPDDVTDSFSYTMTSLATSLSTSLVSQSTSVADESAIVPRASSHDDPYAEFQSALHLHSRANYELRCLQDAQRRVDADEACRLSPSKVDAALSPEMEQVRRVQSARLQVDRYERAREWAEHELELGGIRRSSAPRVQTRWRHADELRSQAAGLHELAAEASRESQRIRRALGLARSTSTSKSTPPDDWANQANHVEQRGSRALEWGRRPPGSSPSSAALLQMGVPQQRRSRPLSAPSTARRAAHGRAAPSPVSPPVDAKQQQEPRGAPPTCSLRVSRPPRQPFPAPRTIRWGSPKEVVIPARLACDGDEEDAQALEVIYMRARKAALLAARPVLRGAATAPPRLTVHDSSAPYAPVPFAGRDEEHVHDVASEPEERTATNTGANAAFLEEELRRLQAAIDKCMAEVGQ